MNLRELIKGGNAAVFTLGALYILAAVLFVFGGIAAGDVRSLKAKMDEFRLLGAEYRDLNAKVSGVEQKASLTKTSGLAQALEELSGSLGLKNKLRSVKGLGTKDLKGMIEESAEVQLDKVNTNELVNILFKIENAPMILTIKRVTVKKVFDNPELLDVSMTLSLFTKGQENKP